MLSGLRTTRTTRTALARRLPGGAEVCDRCDGGRTEERLRKAIACQQLVRERVLQPRLGIGGGDGGRAMEPKFRRVAWARGSFCSTRSS